MKKPKTCSCAPSTEYFDAEGRAFNVFNRKCKIHGFPLTNQKTRLTEEMKLHLLANRDLPFYAGLKLFNDTFGTNRGIQFMYNARKRYL